MHACVPMSSVGDNAMTLRVSGPVPEYSLSCYVNDNSSEHTGLNIWCLSLSDRVCVLRERQTNLWNLIIQFDFIRILMLICKWLEFN